MKKLFLALTLIFAACGGTGPQKTGTVIFTANGEDFVRKGFVSEDGWSIQFEKVFVNVYGPTAYQVVENNQPLISGGLRHGGHPHEDIPEGAAHVSLLGDYFINLKTDQDPLEIGRVDEAPIGNYNRLAFTVRPASTNSNNFVAGFEGASLAFIGTASKQGSTIHFDIRFDEQMAYSNCGPNEDAGVLAENSQAIAEMTFHVDHVFGDEGAGPADTQDQESVNYIAVGFGPFAELASGDTLQITQKELGEKMTGTLYLQLIDAVRTMGHSGEAHCHLD
jgi:hypothetical protein